MTGATWRGYCSAAISGQANCLVGKGLKSEQIIRTTHTMKT